MCEGTVGITGAPGLPVMVSAVLTFSSNTRSPRGPCELLILCSLAVHHREIKVQIRLHLPKAWDSQAGGGFLGVPLQKAPLRLNVFGDKGRSRFCGG